MTFEDLPNALLVEDDAQDRLQVRLQLELMGFVVYDSPSKLEAQELFGQRDYSIVLIHLGHSPLESMQLCRSIRAESTVPIIMLTQRDEIVDEEMVLSAGADDYVTKPIVERILTSRITQQVKRGQTQRAPRANIRAEDADEYIGGLMIMNDLSARRLQMEEMLLNLGPAKGKDFSLLL